MPNLIPMDDNVIVRIIPYESKIGLIAIPDSAIEKSNLAEVIVPNIRSYHRDGSKRDIMLVKGTKVRIPSGKIGTHIPEAPAGEEWLAIPEDCIYYIVEE